ncbi:hypothetical protein [Kitasatospora sp. NPDC059327]|uniref:hypothetical protein n=1 Tax=Kitasatospora sp. NPDC059327 TaxID=3346803 RepID=UPI0036A84B67
MTLTIPRAERAQTQQPAPRFLAKVSVPGAFAGWLEGTGAVQGQDDIDPDCLALRLAFDASEPVRRGRSISLVVEGDTTVMAMLAEYAKRFLDTFNGNTGEATRAELNGAKKTLERATAAHTSLHVAA